MNLAEIKEILQKEWGYLTRDDKRHILATPNVKWCTAFYGTDEFSEIGFMCHFDFPRSTKSLPELFIVLENNIPKNRNIVCYLDGGYCFAHSYFTRKRIIMYIDILNMQGWNIKLIQKPYNVQLFPPKLRLGKGITFDMQNMKVGNYPMKPQIRSKPKLREFLRSAAKFTKQ